MPCCHVCGETKPVEDFRNMPNFTKYKKHKVTWCRACQKVWIDMKKEMEKVRIFRGYVANYSVSFD